MDDSYKTSAINSGSIRTSSSSSSSTTTTTTTSEIYMLYIYLYTVCRNTIYYYISCVCIILIANRECI